MEAEPVKPAGPRRRTPEVFTAPLFLGTGFLLVGVAMIEKVLNLLGTSLPVLTVFPRQLLDWAVMLMILEIAITLRQIAQHLESRDSTIISDLGIHN